MSLKTFFTSQFSKSSMASVTLYAPLCLMFCFVVYVFAKIQVDNITEKKKQEEYVFFKKHEGSLKQQMLNVTLQELGLSRQQTNDIIKRLDKILNMRRLAPKDRYLLTFTQDDKFKMLVITKDFSRYYVADVDGELVAGILDISVKPRERSAKGDIQGSLFASMQHAGMKPSFIIDFADVFSWSIDFNSETRSGDKFAAFWEEEYTAGGSTLNETILAAYYDGGYSGKIYAFRFEDEYYDQNGKFSKKMFLKSPISVRGARITSRFTNSRLHPILRITRPHLGIDYAAPVGTPVETVADGTVMFKGWKGGFGNYLEISHPNGYVTCYGHLRDFGKNVNIGAKVRQGQTIGYIGSSGLSTGPHLDFRIRQNNKYMDFLNNKNRSSAAREIPKEKKEEFYKIRDKYVKVLDDIKPGEVNQI